MEIIMAKKSKDKELDMSVIENQTVVNVDLDKEMKKAYIDYAMSVIVSRALPDVRDGMKPLLLKIRVFCFQSALQCPFACTELFRCIISRTSAAGDKLCEYTSHSCRKAVISFEHIKSACKLRLKEIPH